MTLTTKKGQQVQIDAEDLPLLGGKPVGIDTEGYAFVPAIDNKRNRTRLQVLLLGKMPKGRVVDHINGDKTDYRRANLRVVGWQENQINRKRLNKNNTSGVRGVCFYPARKGHQWKAQIHVNYHGVSLGFYATAEQAIAARHAAELKYFGELCPTSEVAA